MDDVSLGALFGVLIFLILLSACFSGSETALMTLNRYRLRHLAKEGNPGAVRAQRLLERPDRLIGLILLGNNFVNIFASALATVIALRLWGQAGIAIATGLLTLVILIFAEVAPKTLAALHPERVAFPASFVFVPLLKLVYPLVWLVNTIANRLLRVFGVSPENASNQALSREELRTLLAESSPALSRRYQHMLISILDLEEATVQDIMVPRTEVSAICLDDDMDEILQQLTGSPYTMLPVYENELDNIIGFLPLRKTLVALRHGKMDKDTLRGLLQEPYFIPEGTKLNQQLLNFQSRKRRMGLVVDEYGDLEGLVTLTDIVEEIVGEFTPASVEATRDVHPQDDGSYLVDGSANVRELNRAMGWKLPTDGPKTLNGLIVEYLEDIPETNTSLRLAGYSIEIVQVKGNAAKVVRFYPAPRDREVKTTA